VRSASTCRTIASWSGIGAVASDFCFPLFAVPQSELMEGLAAVVGQKGVAAKDDREQLENVAAPCVVFGEDVRPLVEEVALAAWQAQDLAEVDFQEILADRQRAPEIQAPMPAAGEDAPAQPAVCYVVNAAQVNGASAWRAHLLRPAVRRRHDRGDEPSASPRLRKRRAGSVARR